MRYLAVLLSSLLVLIQYPLWYGKGGWLRVWELESELSDQRHVNEERRLRNAALIAEVNDLRTGTDAIEELARVRLGMVKPGEIFVHLGDTDSSESASVGAMARRGENTVEVGSRRPMPPPSPQLSGASTSPVAAVVR